MNFEKSKVLLKKINALYAAADEALGVSALERDLMLQYIRDFYEAISETQPPKPALNYEERRSHVRIAEPNTASLHSTASKPHEVPVAVPPPATPTAVDPSILPTNEVLLKTESPKPANPKEISEEMRTLFADSEKEDQGGRYLGSKVTDISRAMGINDKILTINELFKGDQALFNETLTQLNTMSTFEEAKKFIGTGVAQQLQWSDTRLREKAINFINLIRRRYSS